MGKQSGPLTLTGTIKGITYYESKQFGYLFRRKGGVSGERIATDPAFEATRKNSLEFGHAAKAAKLLRNALATAIKPCADHALTGRFTKGMVKVVQGDTAHEKGMRHAAQGDHMALAGLAFRVDDATARFLSGCTVSHDHTTGTIELSTMRPTMPKGATCYSLRLLCAAVDFETGTFVTAYAETDNTGDNLPAGKTVKIAAIIEAVNLPVFISAWIVFGHEGVPMPETSCGGIAGVIPVT